MNRRTLLFILCVSLSFFFVEMYFAQRSREKNKAWFEQQEAMRKKRLDELRQSVAQRTAELSDLPIGVLYRNPEETIPLGRALLTKNAALVIADDLPQKAFFLEKEYELIAVENYVGIYSVDGSQLSVALPYDLGKFDLQLIPASVDAAPIVTLAEYADGSFFSLLEEPVGFSLVAMRRGDNYFPAGVYDAQSGRFFILDQLQMLSDGIAIERAIEVSQVAGKETFYVLENEYQQLVFSDIGASLVELNLPFSDTVVRPVAIDTKIEEQSPENSTFPLEVYYSPGEDPQGPFKENIILSKEGHYPLLRRTQIIRGRVEPIEVQHRALNVVSSYPEVAKLRYRVKSFEKDRIVFEATQRHRKITKSFFLPQGQEVDPYLIEVEVKVDGDSRGLWLTSGLVEAELVSGRAAPAVKVRQTRNGNGEVENLRLPKDALTVSSFNPDWITVSNGFFGIIVDPMSRIDAGYMVQHVVGVEAPTRLTLVDRQNQRYKAKDFSSYNALLPLNSQGGLMQFRVYAGPFAGTTLSAVDSSITERTGENSDYVAAQSYHGWFSWVSEPIAKVLFFIMRFFYGFTSSWALSIVLLTVVVRAVLFPLNTWSMRSMRKTQKIGPLLKAIQNKYKKDPKRMQLEVMNLYREHKVNPLGGCLPMLIQLPFLMGMFDLLRSAFELRGAPFISGWINDLASPDVLFQWSTSLPFIGTEFHLLPFVMGAVMFLQSKLMASAPVDPNNLTEAEQQQKMMTLLMPVMMVLLFYNFASGLNIYMISSTLLGILQQYYINYTVDKENVDLQSPVSQQKQKGKHKHKQLQRGV